MLIGSADASINVPVEKRVLGEFISGLLGQPQSIERSFESIFSIDHDWLVHLCSLILQRINQQNAPEPLAFEAHIYYQNGVERRLTTLPAFNHFAETQAIVSTGIKINLSVLIQFPNKSVPERQELILHFLTREWKSDIFENLFGRQSGTGFVSIEIRHTERTWADDLMRLISDEVDAICLPENGIKKTFRKVFFPFAFFSVPVIMIASLALAAWSERGLNTRLQAQTLDILSSKNLDIVNLHAKVNILLERANAAEAARFGSQSFLIWSLLIMIIVFLGGVFVGRPSPSFVIMSKAAEKYREKTLRKLKRKYWALLGSMGASVVLAIAANFIYDYLK